LEKTGESIVRGDMIVCRGVRRVHRERRDWRVHRGDRRVYI
jgi:predicted Fe-S protein YdhL (DUF1289 family)